MAMSAALGMGTDILPFLGKVQIQRPVRLQIAPSGLPRTRCS